MKCYYCGRDIPEYAEGVKLVSPKGDDVYIHDVCLFMIEINKNGVIQK